MKSNLINLFSMSLIASGAFAGSFDSPAYLSDWVARKPPESGEDRWLDANNDAEHEWVVYLVKDRPMVRLWKEKSGEAAKYLDRRNSSPSMPFKVPLGSMKEGLAGEWSSVEVEDGWLVGYNAGEWGAWLWWFSPDGTKRYQISKDWVVGFFKSKAGLFALAGIDSVGQVVRLSKGKDGQWHSEKFIDMRGGPEVGVIGADGTLTVATNDRLLRVDLTGKKIDVLLKNAFWGGLYPESMILTESGDIYVGMRHGVAKIEKMKRSYQVKWLLPNLEFDRPRPPGFR